MGKLARWLRMMGYDSLFFDSGDDSQMVLRALAEGRVLLTRDREIMKRRVVGNGRLKAVLMESEDPEQQMRQLLETCDLISGLRPFTLCLECNRPLAERSRQEVRARVPPHVYETQEQFMECPDCGRIYWRGTHWTAMMKRLEEFRDFTLDSGERRRGET